MDSSNERHRKIAAAIAHLHGDDLMNACHDALENELSNHRESQPALAKILYDLLIKYMAREAAVLPSLRKDVNLEPNHLLFQYFRFKRLGEIFQQYVSIPQSPTLVYPTDTCHSHTCWRY
jgi:hypothetical protein